MVHCLYCRRVFSHSQSPLSQDPVANSGTMRYVVIPVEGDYQVYIALELNLPPYHETGSISVPPYLHKARLISQTGISLVCGPTGELCICYHNGWELQGAMVISSCVGWTGTLKKVPGFGSLTAFRQLWAKWSTPYQETVKPAVQHTCHILGSSDFPLACVSHWYSAPVMSFWSAYFPVIRN